jgi:hypothetical protein
MSFAHFFPIDHAYGVCTHRKKLRTRKKIRTGAFFSGGRRAAEKCGNGGDGSGLATRETMERVAFLLQQERLNNETRQLPETIENGIISIALGNCLTIVNG